MPDWMNPSFNNFEITALDGTLILISHSNGRLPVLTSKDILPENTYLEEVRYIGFLQNIQNEEISFDIHMSHKMNRIFRKFCHTQIMKAKRHRRTQKRVKEQSRRAILKWNALHPHEKHRLK